MSLIILEYILKYGIEDAEGEVEYHQGVAPYSKKVSLIFNDMEKMMLVKEYIDHIEMREDIEIIETDGIITSVTKGKNYEIAKKHLLNRE